jgi:hypothetical protein
MAHFSLPRIAAVLTLAVVAAACTSTTDQATAEAALCDSLAAYNTSVQAIADLSPDTASVDDLNAATDAASTAWDQVVEDAAAVTDADTASIDSAWDDFAAAVADLPSDVAVTDALATLQPSIDAVQSSYTEIADGLSCEM